MRQFSRRRAPRHSQHVERPPKTTGPQHFRKGWNKGIGTFEICPYPRDEHFLGKPCFSITWGGLSVLELRDRFLPFANWYEPDYECPQRTALASEVDRDGRIRTGITVDDAQTRVADRLVRSRIKVETDGVCAFFSTVWDSMLAVFGRGPMRLRAPRTSMPSWYVQAGYRCK